PVGHRVLLSLVRIEPHRSGARRERRGERRIARIPRAPPRNRRRPPRERGGATGSVRAPERKGALTMHQFRSSQDRPHGRRRFAGALALALAFTTAGGAQEAPAPNEPQEPADQFGET